MSIVRHYVMRAAEGREEALEEALAELADVARGLAGNEGVELLRDQDDTGRFFFIERFASIEDHKNGGANLPKPLMSRIMEALDGGPDGGYLVPLKAV